MPQVKLKCSCGSMQGRTRPIDADSGSRIACCCRDCQSFSHFLGKADEILDEYGGTDIYQMPVSHLQITEGIEHLACLKLDEKGLHRWYAQCCNTPIGNTMGSGAPFVGVIHNFMDHEKSRDEELGPLRGYGLIKFAKKKIPSDVLGSSTRLILRTLSNLLIWKLKGLNKPSNFFDENGRSIVQPKVLDENSREQLIQGL